ncbi:MlaD family protein, partial [Mycobacterium sp. FLAC0960]|uniref:MlaD family protein n=1 Tax=Mycobacterium sp. FLAC0960 TaxID=3053611 RepID=UPI002598853F
MEGSPVQINDSREPPYKFITLLVVVVLGVIFTLVYIQFRGGFTPKTELTMLAARAGLVMDPGSKVTYNGVEIGRVGSIAETVREGK